MDESIPIAIPVDSTGIASADVLYLAAKAVEDTDYNKAATLYRRAMALGCTHSLYALGTMYTKYLPCKRLSDDMPIIFAGRHEIKQAAKERYAPALYRMHWYYKGVVVDHYLHSYHPATPRIVNHIKDKAFQKSAYYLREAKACDPDGYALMFEINRLKWELAFPEVIDIRVLIERYRLAIEIVQNLPNKDLVYEHITAYLNTLNIYLDNVARKGRLDSRPNELEERCRAYYMLGMACKDLNLLSEARKNFGLAAALVLPQRDARFGPPLPLPVEHQLAREELLRM